MSSDRPRHPMAPATAAPKPRAPYLFADKPPGHQLSDADMARLCGPGAHMEISTRALKGMFYPAPPGLACRVCLGSRTPRACLVPRFKVAPIGRGYLDVRMCFHCSRQGCKCSASSRSSGAYVAFVDWGRAVLVDRATLRVRNGASDGDAREDDGDTPEAAPSPAAVGSTGDPELDAMLADADVRWKATLAGMGAAIDAFAAVVVEAQRVEDERLAAERGEASGGGGGQEGGEAGGDAGGERGLGSGGGQA
ncbi:hypothetical protein Q8F55_007446 [Vanrija albida]|uniref:Uncharacterized protein n=1 Tax=Vanrija albida TaxID=181172 RepID=A0ABR3PTK5_9TREE